MSAANKGTRVNGLVATAPTGSVTLMFTDIEGSTKLLELLRETYAAVLEHHRDLLRAAFAQHDGYEVDTQGDLFFVAFGSAPNAVACSVEIQRAIAAHDWPQAADVRVRIGIHTGQPTLAPTGYVGVDVHRGARIGAAAHGGQVLVSRATVDALGSEVDGRFAFDDLGVHRFKGLAEPTAVLGVRADGLLTDFPPIRASAPEEEAPTPGEPPYKGLLRFEADDAELYFGREELVGLVAAAVRERPFICVIGASGSGKSSLVRAGVIPAVSASADFDHLTVLTPTADPLAALGSALEEPGLVVVDQFEEVFTLCRDEEVRREFVDRLMSAPGERVHVLVTLRADFYAEVSQFPELRAAVAENQVYIGPMEPADLRRAIEEPARRGGWEIAPGLVDLLLRDIGNEPGALPLLSHALLETWHRRRGSRMTLKGYFESGEVSGAIARTADRLYAELPSAEQQVARNILLRLTELGEGAQDTRRRAALDELVPSGGGRGTQEVLRRLIDARLVMVDEGTAEVAHEALIREWPLLREWLRDDREGLRIQRQVTDSAAEWHALAREPSLLFRGARLATAREWAAANPGTLTEREVDFLNASIAEEERDERERAEQQQRALEAAQRAAEVERLRAEEQTAAARSLRRRAVFLAGLLIVAAGLGIAAFLFANQANEQATIARDQTTVAQEQQAEAERQRSEAEAQRTTALGRQLVAQSLSTRPDTALSALLALEGVDRAPSPEAWDNLAGVLDYLPEVVTHHRVEGDVIELAASPDGAQLAVLTVVSHETQEAQLSIFSSATWQRISGPHPSSDVRRRAPSMPTDTHVAFSPNGRRVAFAGRNTIEVLDLPTNETTEVPWNPPWDIPAGLSLPFDSISWSPDGQRLTWTASSPTDSQLPLLVTWEIEAATVEEMRLVPALPEAEAGDFFHQSFIAPGGAWVVTEIDFAFLEVFDTATARRVSGMENGALRGFSADGRFMAVATPVGMQVVTMPELDPHGVEIRSDANWVDITTDGAQVRLWADGQTMSVADVEFGFETTASRDSNAHLAAIAAARGDLRFVAQGDSILVVRADRTTRLDVPSSGSLSLHQGVISAMSDDGRAIALWDQEDQSQDRSIRIVDLNGTLTDTVQWDAPITGLALGPDHKTVLVLEESGRLTSTRPGEATVELARLPDGFGQPAMSASGAVAVGLDEVTYLVSNGQLTTLPLAGGGAAFMPDGEFVLLPACNEGEIRLVSVVSGEVTKSIQIDGCPLSVDVNAEGTLALVAYLPGAEEQRTMLMAYDLTADEPTGRFGAGASQISHARFLDGEPTPTAVTISESVRLWSLDREIWRSAACELAGRDLTQAEWERYLPGEEYRETCP